MRYLILTGLCLATAAMAAPKPKKVIATDVQCTSCVDAQDVAPDAIGPGEIQDGAVGESELTQALLDRINALEAELAGKPRPVQILANGEAIGAFIGDGFDLYREGVAGAPPSIRRLHAISKTGYSFAIDTDTTVNLAGGRLTNSVPDSIWFDEPGCAGDAYIREFIYRRFQGQGVVVGLKDEANRAYYLRPDATIREDVTALSSWHSGTFTCEEPQLNNGPFAEIFPNDPTITGIPNEPFTPPITLGR